MTGNTVTKAAPSQLPVEFVNHQQATAIFGLSRSHLYQLASEGAIKSVSLRKRNQIKGKRLFVADSIREFLTRHIVENSPTV